jgi:protein SCO1/2
MGGMFRWLSTFACGAALFVAACDQAAPAKRYELTGQVLSVQADKSEITVRHDDIPGFMPAMTMSYPVTPTTLLEGRRAGELIAATLEVTDTQGRLVAIASRGDAPVAVNANQLAMASELLAEGDAVPDAALIDQTDRRRSFSEWTGSVTLVTFIYTSCPVPTYCPLMDQNFATIQGALREDPVLRGQVRLVSVTFDPEHDSPAVLSAHAAKRHADPEVWTFLTGDRITVDRFAGKFGVGVVRPEDKSEITHSLRTTLIGKDGHVRKIYSGNDWTPHAVLTDLRAAVAAS